MKQYRASLGAALALLPLCVAATTVEVTFDVNVKTKWLPERIPYYPMVTWKTDESFVPQSFTLTARFDLEDPYVALTGKQSLTIFSGGNGASVGTTPYTAALRAGVQDGAENIQASFGANPVVSDTPSLSAYWGLFSATTSVQTVTGDVGEFLHYNRSINLSEYFTGTSPGNYTAPSGDEFVAWLQERTGRTFTGYSEQFYRQVTKAVRYGDEWFPSGNPADRISVEGELLNGEITLRAVSVSAVPEPSSLLLMLLGLAAAGTAAVRARR